MSGLLNAINGVVAPDDRILFITTNHIDQLDPALIRPGRIDHIFKIGYADRHQAKGLFLLHFPDQPELAESFATECTKTEVAPADIQSWLLVNHSNGSEFCSKPEGMFDMIERYRAISSSLKEAEEAHKQKLDPDDEGDRDDSPTY